MSTQYWLWRFVSQWRKAKLLHMVLLLLMIVNLYVFQRAGRPLLMTYRAVGSGEELLPSLLPFLLCFTPVICSFTSLLLHVFALSLFLLTIRTPCPCAGTGQKEFLAKKTAFGGSEIPLTQEQVDASLSRGQEVLHIPHVLGAIAFFHNVPATVTGGQNVKLTATLLAKIFQRDIKTWDHPDILAVNPGLTFPAGQNIHVYHHTLDSSSTSLVSQYFDVVAGSVWRLGVNKLLQWPAGQPRLFVGLL